MTCTICNDTGIAMAVTGQGSYPTPCYACKKAGRLKAQQPELPPEPTPETQDTGDTAMDVLTALHILKDAGAALEPDGNGRIQISNPQAVSKEALICLRDHKPMLLPMVYGGSSCYIPGHLLPLDLSTALVMAIYHFPLEAGIGIAQRKGEDSWLWYLQGSPEATQEAGNAARFMARLVELGVRAASVADEQLYHTIAIHQEGAAEYEWMITLQPKPKEEAEADMGVAHRQTEGHVEYFVLPAGDAVKRAGKEGRCRSCSAVIYWVETASGKKLPMDPDGVTHFATCPQSKSWSGKGRAA
jgi:hypothetical protein